eukprot:gb/GECH01003260.1/.p1 GENE.gb/GECH01003260.1/~~gb/GECH01003260.1/.p1  ORF type:complete len:272 (+),score=83.00 gb/GECH01003260.1/:1-816(+)
MLSLKYLLVFLIGFLFLIALSNAQDEEVEVDIEDENENENVATGTETAPASPVEVETSHLFPDHPDEKLPIGEVVDLLLGVANSGEQDYTIEAMQGFLVSPVDYSFFLQNFTAFWYNTSIPASSEATAMYRFRSNPNLEPRDYALIVQAAFRTPDNSSFAYTLFNSTLVFEEMSSGFNPNDVFAYTAILGTFGLLGFGIFKIFENQSKGKKPQKQQRETPSPQEDSGEIRSEWLPKEELRRMEQRKQKKGSKQKGASNKPRRPLHQPSKTN